MILFSPPENLIDYRTYVLYNGIVSVDCMEGYVMEEMRNHIHKMVDEINDKNTTEYVFILVKKAWEDFQCLENQKKQKY